METKKKPLILLVDDYIDFHKQMIFAFRDFEFISAYSVDGGKKVSSNPFIDLAILDLCFNESIATFDGFELIDHFNKYRPDVPLIILSNFAEHPHVQERLKKTKSFFLSKSDFNLKKWQDIFKNNLKQNDLQHETDSAFNRQ